MTETAVENALYQEAHAVPYSRKLVGTNVVPRWCVLGAGENRDEPPFGLYAQTHWGLSRLSEPEFASFADALEFLDAEVIPQWPGGLRTVPQWTVAGSGEGRQDPPFELCVPTGRGRYVLREPRFEHEADAEEFLLREIIPLGRLDSAR